MAAIMTPYGLLSFPNLFTPRAPAEGTEPRYSINLVFDEKAQKAPEYIAMQKAVIACAKEEFGDDVNLKGLRLPFRDAGEKEYAGYNDGDMFVSAWTKQKPGLVNAQRSEILDPSDVWAGQLARATIKPFAYNVSGNKGVSFALNNVQIVKKDMPRLDGRKAAEDDFDEVDDGSASDNEDVKNAFN